MIQGKSVLAVIPARGGSKGLPKKNILPLAGKPIIGWTIDAAKKAKYTDRVIISTEDEEIASIATRMGCEIPFMRPKELSTDKANSNHVILHAINNISPEFDYVVSLQPTSPLRNSDDIDSALEYIVKKNAPSLVSMCESKKPLNWHHYINEDGLIQPCYSQQKLANRRQDTIKTFVPNGAIYVAKTEFFKKHISFYHERTIALKMQHENSVDIDSGIDLIYAEILVKKLTD